MDAGGTPAHVDLTAAYGSPMAVDRRGAFTVEGHNSQHVTFRANDNQILRTDLVASHESGDDAARRA